jgi:hypothetical protein
MRIGCCWAGTPRFSRDVVRSIPYPLFAPLFDLPGTTWTALFTGPQRDDCPPHPNCERPALPTIRDTARQMLQIDLMITVDSLPVHLAGTLGVPTWLLLPYSADWRWLLDRTDTPWYPSVTLYRAPAWDTWPPVIERVRHDLTHLTRKAA